MLVGLSAADPESTPLTVACCTPAARKRLFVPKSRHVVPGPSAQARIIGWTLDTEAGVLHVLDERNGRTLATSGSARSAVLRRRC